MDRKVKSSWLLCASVLLAGLVFAATVMAQKPTQVKGVITGRSGADMTLQIQGSESITVTLTSGTVVDEADGVLSLRKKQLGLTALIPGLPVEVKGNYNDQHKLVADQVKFKASDLRAAQDMQAGLQPTEKKLASTQEEVAANSKELQLQEQQIQAAKAREAANKAAIAANQAAIAAANKRFGELGDYNILGETTVYFANGVTSVDAKYKPELKALATKAAGITAYIIQVQGYASAVGSAALNQKLSQERADHVLQYLEQDCNVPLTNVLAPGAMGTSNQVASDKTSEGQSLNRRVVVRILQNKGIAGN